MNEESVFIYIYIYIYISLILFTVQIVSLFTLFTLITETRVGKARAKRLEGDTMSLGNCRHVYSLLADKAVIT